MFSYIRILWSLILLIAASFTLYLEILFVQRFIERPLVTSLERDYYTWNTTFPSFTLCGQEKINETALEIYLRYKIVLKCKKKYQITYDLLHIKFLINLLNIFILQ